MTILKKDLAQPNPVTGRKIAYLVRVEGKRDAATGKRRQYTRQVPTKAEAKALEAEWTAEIERGTALLPSKTTVGDLLNHYIATEIPRTVRPENRQPYTSIIEQHIRPVIGNVLARSLTVEHVEKMLSDLQEAGYSSSLVTKARMRLSSALNLGIRWNIVGRNVATVAKAPKIEYKTATIWKPEEISVFLNVARQESHWPFWLLMVETGARQSELLGLSWQDIDMDHSTLRLGRRTVRLLKGTPQTKDGGKSKAAGRTVGLTAGTVKELRVWRTQWLENKLANDPEWNPEALLFTTAAGTPLSANNLRKVFDRLVRDAGVTEITPHAIRKTNITLALAGGASPKAVSQRVGHADSRVTLDVYAQTTSGQEEQLVGIMGAIVSQNHAEEFAGKDI